MVEQSGSESFFSEGRFDTFSGQNYSWGYIRHFTYESKSISKLQMDIELIQIRALI
jgi:hypothetical protein